MPSGQGTVQLDIAVDTTTLIQKACERSMVSVGWGEGDEGGHEGMRRRVTAVVVLSVGHI